MSRKQTNQNECRIQFIVKNDDLHFKVIQDILSKYPSGVKANSFKAALRDLQYILEYTESENAIEVIKKFKELRNGNPNKV
jgi:hypothetical protein